MTEIIEMYIKKHQETGISFNELLILLKEDTKLTEEDINQNRAYIKWVAQKFKKKKFKKKT